MQTILEWLRAPWPWYISGILIGLMVPAMLLLTNKRFGISSSYRQLCAASIPLSISYFRDYDWKDQIWRLWLVGGIILGGFIAAHYLNGTVTPELSDGARSVLAQWGLGEVKGLVPEQLYSWQGLQTMRGFLVIVAGGFLMGFGTRYANGCTSGHSIMGLSMLNPASLVATIFFFAGGAIMAHFILPFILQ